MRILDASESDYQAVLDLNESVVPHVNSISRDTLAKMADESFYFRVAREGDEIPAFLLAFAEGADYDSPNFLWFRPRYPRYVYIDRVVVSEHHRRGGLGRQLYQDLCELASPSVPLLTCEVNLSPPNPGSLAFHLDLGFREVGQQETEEGYKRVALMVLEL